MMFRSSHSLGLHFYGKKDALLLNRMLLHEDLTLAALEARCCCVYVSNFHSWYFSSGGERMIICQLLLLLRGERVSWTVVSLWLQSVSSAEAEAEAEAASSHSKECMQCTDSQQVLSSTFCTVFSFVWTSCNCLCSTQSSPLLLLFTQTHNSYDEDPLIAARILIQTSGADGAVIWEFVVCISCSERDVHWYENLEPEPAPGSFPLQQHVCHKTAIETVVHVQQQMGVCMLWKQFLLVSCAPWIMLVWKRCYGIKISETGVKTFKFTWLSILHSRVRRIDTSVTFVQMWFQNLELTQSDEWFLSPMNDQPEYLIRSLLDTHWQDIRCIRKILSLNEADVEVGFWRQEREVGGGMIDTRQTHHSFVGVYDDCIVVSWSQWQNYAFAPWLAHFFGFEKTHNIPLSAGKLTVIFQLWTREEILSKMCGKKIPGYKFWTDRTWFEFLRLGPLMLMLVFGCIILLFVPNHMKDKEWPKNVDNDYQLISWAWHHTNVQL